MIESIENLCCYVAGQILGAWVAPESTSASRVSCECSAVLRLSQDECVRAACGWLKRRSDVGLRYRRKFSDRGEGLGLALFRHVDLASRAGAKILVLGDPCYPRQLATIQRPPLALSMLGELGNLADAVGVVGSRKASRAALLESFELGQWLAEQGLSVISGGAFGCDIAVHKGMLANRDHDLQAVVVLAGGLSRLYPQSHTQTFRSIVAAGGALLSEQMWLAPAYKSDFPNRNRIISGMCESLLLMEAGERSGALLTANLALDQGRDVYVNLKHGGGVQALGNSSLLAQGALGFEGARGFQEGCFLGLSVVQGYQ